MSEERRFPRKTDIAMWVNIFILCGLVWAAYGKPAAWDQAKKDIDELRPIVNSDHTSIAVLLAQLESINKHLESIDRKTL